MRFAVPCCRLDIAHAWEGTPLAAVDHAQLLLRLGPRHLLVAVDAPFHGDPPPPGLPGPTEGLWEYEVVELFLASVGDTAYAEVELSPHGHHLVLRLAGVRQRVAAGLPLAFRTRRAGRRWQGVARLDRRHLPPPPWRGNAFAIHGPASDRRHLAASPLPGVRPDFHQPDRFPLLAWTPSVRSQPRAAARR